MEKSEASQTVFLDGMKTKYPVILHDYTYYDIDKLYSKVMRSDIQWNQTDIDLHHNPAYITHDDRTTTPESRRRRDAAHTNVHNDNEAESKTGSEIEISHIDDEYGDHSDDHDDDHGEHEHSFEEDLGHGFHKASITILGILVIEVRHFGSIQQHRNVTGGYMRFACYMWRPQCQYFSSVLPHRHHNAPMYTGTNFNVREENVTGWICEHKHFY